ncbi:MAG TPA: hypothetical protein DD381_14225 [Lentisphaeria bacterium]|nr:MAG: hypothetical protein A2X47_01040 [Lentisphaerae bacterium GWF2_38_69]HBM17481.1 hypothetical protein [Lentisphaeria bacterium]
MIESILTLGPASSDEDTIISLLEVAGRFRLNTSHMSCGEIALWLKKLERLFAERSRKIDVVMDLQGSKMRIGEIKSFDTFPEKICFFYGVSSDKADMIPVPHTEFFSAVKKGDHLSLNDNRIIVEVTGISKDEVTCRVIRNGKLSSRKGINRSNHPIPFEKLSSKDEEIIKISMMFDFTQFAFSFVFDGNESEKIRPLAKDRKIIAKIERPEAMANLKKIDRLFDEMWLCRGDLGAQAGIFQLGRLQEEFSSQLKEFKKPCILAGQVLEHMTNFHEPTRSEVVHLYDIEKRGYKGFVLSDETAVGKNPLSIAVFLKEYNSLR